METQETGPHCTGSRPHTPSARAGPRGLDMQQGALCRGHSGEGQGHTTPVLATRETRGCRMRAAADHMQPGRPGLDAGTEAGGALTAPGRLLAWGRQQGWQSAGVLCTRGTLQGEPYTGRSAARTREDSRPPGRLRPATPRQLARPRPGRFLKGTAALSPQGTRSLRLLCVERSWRGRRVDGGAGPLRGCHWEAPGDHRAVRPEHRPPRVRAAPRLRGAVFISE